MNLGCHHPCRLQGSQSFAIQEPNCSQYTQTTVTLILPCSSHATPNQLQWNSAPYFFLLIIVSPMVMPLSDPDFISINCFASFRDHLKPGWTVAREPVMLQNLNTWLQQSIVGTRDLVYSRIFHLGRTCWLVYFDYRHLASRITWQLDLECHCSCSVYLLCSTSFAKRRFA